MARNRAGEGGDRERIEERRRQILDAAATVFARRGYHRTRMREIADEAGVAVGTIYIYFANKRDLLLSLIQHVVMRSMPEMLAHLHADDPKAWLRDVLHERLAMLEDNRELIRAVAPEMITHADLQQEYLRQVVLPFLRQLSPLWQRTLRGAHVRPFNPQIVLPALIGSAIAAFVVNESAELLGTKPCSREEIVAEIADTFLDGLLARGDPLAHLPGRCEAGAGS